MGKLVEELRQVVELDGLRVQRAREHADLLRDMEGTAARLAALGDQERPKTEAFLRTVTDAATFTAGGDGAAAKRPAPDAISTGGEDGTTTANSGGSTTGPVLVYGRGQAAGIAKSREWLDDHCQKRTEKILNPMNPFAALKGDYVEVEVWDCSIELGPGVVFFDPESYQSLLGPGISAKSSGGAKGGGGAGQVNPVLGRTTIRGAPGQVVGGNIGSGAGLTPGSDFSTVPTGFASGSSTAPTADGRLIQDELRKGFGRLVQAVESTGDLGLAIRRNGGI